MRLTPATLLCKLITVGTSLRLATYVSGLVEVFDAPYVGLILEIAVQIQLIFHRIAHHIIARHRIARHRIARKTHL